MVPTAGKDELRRAISIACKCLAYRDRSREEVARHLAKKKLPLPVISEALDKLATLDYLNDERFAANWGRLRINNKKFGKIRVMQELIDKGVDPQLAEKTLDKVYMDVDERLLAETSAKKKLAQINNPDANKKRRSVAQFLARRGFAPDVIEQTIDRLIPSLTDG